MHKAKEKIDDAAIAAKKKAGEVINDVADLAKRAAVKTEHAAHEAGTKVKDAGDKLMKATE